MNSICKHMGMG